MPLFVALKTQAPDPGHQQITHPLDLTKKRLKKNPRYSEWWYLYIYTLGCWGSPGHHGKGGGDDITTIFEEFFLLVILYWWQTIFKRKRCNYRYFHQSSSFCWSICWAQFFRRNSFQNWPPRFLEDLGGQETPGHLHDSLVVEPTRLKNMLVKFDHLHR